MSPEFTHTDLEANPQLVAEQQASLAQEWAALYASPELEQGSKSAEIVLRNPSVHLRDIDPSRLPEDLQDKWHGLLSFSDEVAGFAATRPVEWGSDVTGLEKLQSLVRDGDINPSLRGTVSDVMRVSSVLFAESTKHLPGNTKYYAGNVLGAASWLRNEHARQTT